MERSSYFIKDRALFGSFPTQEIVKELEKLGVRYFVNLTHSHEHGISAYTTKHGYTSFPIVDHQVPADKFEFAKFIVKLSDIIYSLDPRELIYIHCKGGHGRSGVVVACLLCHIFKLSPTAALEHTTMYHSNRKAMREKWRRIGSPQTLHQKNFVQQLCRPISFHRAYKLGKTAGFANFSRYRVEIADFGVFPTAEAAIQAYKAPNNIEYVEKQKKSRTPLASRIMGNKIKVREDWISVREQLMYKILRNKFDQNSYIRQTLMSSGLSPIIQRTKEDNIWGAGTSGRGLNLIGLLLVRLRTEYYRE